MKNRRSKSPDSWVSCECNKGEGIQGNTKYKQHPLAKGAHLRPWGLGHKVTTRTPRGETVFRMKHLVVLKPSLLFMVQ